MLLQIYGFTQELDKKVRDGAHWLQQYIARCLIEEIPSKKQLVSIFLEELRDKVLHSTLHSKHHKVFNLCVHDAIDNDDNCGWKNGENAYRWT